MVDHLIRPRDVDSRGYSHADAALVAQFLRDGFVTVQTALPDTFHAELRQHADSILDREGNWGNNILPRLPELQHVLEDPAVHSAVCSLLGPGYALHPHRYCHRNEPGSAGQRAGPDGRPPARVPPRRSEAERAD